MSGPGLIKLIAFQPIFALLTEKQDVKHFTALYLPKIMSAL